MVIMIIIRHCSSYLCWSYPQYHHNPSSSTDFFPKVIILIFTPLTSKTTSICHEWKSKAGRQYNSWPSWTKHMSSSLLLHPPTHSIGFILRRDLIKLAFTVKTCAGARAPSEAQPTILEKAFFELGSKSCIARLFPRRNRDVWISRNSQFNSAQVAHIGKIGNYISLTNQDKWRK